MDRISILPVALLLLSGASQAGESLSCRVQKGLIAGKHPVKTTEFAWGSAHGAGDGQVATTIPTSLGAVSHGLGQDTTAITLGGKPVPLPAEARGVIWGGRVYDFGGQVAVAYQVERQDDSSASPSEVVVLLGKGPKVSAIDVLPGTASKPAGYCVLNQ